MLFQFGDDISKDLNNLWDIYEIRELDGEIVDMCQIKYIDSIEPANYPYQQRNRAVW